MKAAINTLYGSSAGSSNLSRRATNSQFAHERGVPTSVSDVQVATVQDEVVDGKEWQYLANIISQKFALNGSYAIYVLMGDFNDDPSAWATSPNLVGTHAVFAALNGQDASSNPQAKVRRSNSVIQVTGSMPLTSMLLTKIQSGELDSMDPDVVADYLTDNLTCKVDMVRIDLISDHKKVPITDYHSSLMARKCQSKTSPTCQ